MAHFFLKKRIQSNPVILKVAQKLVTTVFIQNVMFLESPNSQQIFWLLLKENLPPKTFFKKAQSGHTDDRQPYLNSVTKFRLRKAFGSGIEVSVAEVTTC